MERFDRVVWEWAGLANEALTSKKQVRLIGITPVNFTPLAGTRATVISSGFGFKLREMQVGARAIITTALLMMMAPADAQVFSSSAGDIKVETVARAGISLEPRVSPK